MRALRRGGGLHTIHQRCSARNIAANAIFLGAAGTMTAAAGTFMVVPAALLSVSAEAVPGLCQSHFLNLKYQIVRPEQNTISVIARIYPAGITVPFCRTMVQSSSGIVLKFIP